MRKYSFLFLLIYAAVFSSCSTILNGKQQQINVSTDSTIKDFELDRGYLFYRDKERNISTKEYEVNRSSKPLIISIVAADSSRKKYEINAKHSAAYWWNIPTTDGLGIIADRFSQKRFAYPTDNYFYIKDSVVYRKSSSGFFKGQVFIRPSYHILNDVTTSFDKKEYDESGGLLGIGIGVDFFINPHKYISADIGTATSKTLCDDCQVPDTINSTSYISIRQNHIVGKFDLGYGINVARFSKTFVDTASDGYTLHNISFGLSLFAQYRITQHFGIGILIQPNIYTFTGKYSGFTSQGYVSFNLNFMIPVKQ